MKKQSQRAGAIEGLVVRFAEGGPRSGPPKPLLLTYMGAGVEEVPGLGVFQHGTVAAADAADVALHQGQRDWRVEPNPAYGREL